MERNYTVNIRKEVRKAPKHKRTNKAVHALLDFIKRHFKTTSVKLGPKINQLLWSRSAKNPPTRFKITGIKDDKDASKPVLVELFGFKYPVKEEKKEEKKGEEKPKKEEKKEEKPKAKPEEKTEEKPKTEVAEEPKVKKQEHKAAVKNEEPKAEKKE